MTMFLKALGRVTSSQTVMPGKRIPTKPFETYSQSRSPTAVDGTEAA